MARWKLTIEYDGSGFYGWQIQAEGTTVQQVIEDAIFKFSGERVRLHVAGRTDAGVHARAQVAHFDLDKDTYADKIMGALNYHTKKHNASIIKVDLVDEEFHARFGAKARYYRYLIINRRPPLALNQGRAWHVPIPLDIEAMQKAAKLLLGTHDFSSFRAKDCQAKTPVKTMDYVNVTKNGELVVFECRAKSFLYHQVRNIIGSLVLVGNGKWSVNDFQKAFDAKSRAAGGPTAPPEGLYFWEVIY